ncbi:MAG: CinA family nicotinamide mononucleotide deamidase-related protein [Candidatus Omnitrophica bacterium]|nr:CinA family nicotinamide mononucleotide deamidase-related protein [Candidatus Omnitrophota bacterium]
MVRVELISVGTELFFHQVNTNIHLISRYLRQAGLCLTRNTTVADNRSDLCLCLQECLSRATVIIVCGGLGPTFDDITREAVADALKRKLVFNQEVWSKIESFFQRRKVVPPESVRKQAWMVEGSTVLPNERGTAPGLLLELQASNQVIILLPGPPAELEGLLAEKVLAYLKQKYPAPETECFRFTVAGLPESVVEQQCSILLERLAKKGELTILTGAGVIDLLVQLPAGEAQLVTAIENELKLIFGKNFLGRESPSLPEVIGKLLLQRGWSLALAESCTGGLMAASITDIPGSSAYFRGSIVAYSNRLKRRLLKVPPTLLRKYGAVSEPVAIAMARGAKKITGADFSLSITGIAGPGGATPTKPVGLVWIGMSLPDRKNKAHQFLFSGTRSQIRHRAVYSGLELLRQQIIAWNKGD